MDNSDTPQLDPAPTPDDTGPILLAVAVNVTTGRASIANGLLSDTDLPIALKAVRLLEAEIENALLRAAERRGRMAAEAQKEKPE